MPEDNPGAQNSMPMPVPQEYAPEEPPMRFGSMPENQNSEIFLQSEMWKAIEKILEDRIPMEKLKNTDLWVVLSNSLKLTFLDNTDLYMFNNLFEAEICRYIRSLPPEKQNFTTHSVIGQARILFEANIRRSVGTPTGKINERIAIITQNRNDTSILQAPARQRSIRERIFG